MPDNIRFDLKCWRQIACKMSGTQNKVFAVVRNPLNGEYFARSLQSAQEFKNEVVWSTDQPELEPESDPPLDFPSGLMGKMEGR